MTLIEKNPNLRELDVRFCGLGDRDLARVLKAAANHPRLEALGIAEGDPSKAFSAALDMFASSSPRMRWL